MADMQEVRAAVDDLEAAIAACENRCIAAGAYMPGFATRLRIYADELAEKYPDETNGGLDALERL